MKRRYCFLLVMLCILATPLCASAALLLDQPLSGTNHAAYTSQQVPQGEENPLVYAADDFVNAQTWDIQKIFVPGVFWTDVGGGTTTTFLNAISLNWEIYANNGGVPSGNPEGTAPSFPAIVLSPSNSQVTLSNGSGGGASDVLLTLTTPIRIPAGHWWLLFYPTMSYVSFGGYGRQVSDTNNDLEAHSINPDGDLGWSTGTAWTPLSAYPLPTTQRGFAFRLEGTSGTVGIGAPEAVDFGNVLFESSPVTQTVTITNTGTLELHISGFSVTGTNFSLGAGGTCGSNLGTGLTCTKIVQFTPATLGHNSGNLQIISDAPITTTNVALSATVGAPDINVTPAALGFGSIAVGLTSTFQTVTITNTGTFAMNITPDITGTSEAMFAIATGGTCSSTLAASAVCTLRVTFTPTENGLQNAILEIVSTDPLSPTVQVALSGTGVYEVTPSALEGTYGTEIQYGGAPGGFGDKKGKIYIAGNKQKIDSWENAQIAMIFTKFKDMAVDTPYDVSIQWKPKGSKTTNIIDLPNAFTLRGPELDALSYHGSPDTEVTITGQWFGTKKGKVIVNGQKCKVTNWTMNPTTGVSTLTFVVHKKLVAGNWIVEVENKIGIARAAFIVD